MELLTWLHGEGATIVMVTHAPDCAAYADRVITLRDGLAAALLSLWQALPGGVTAQTEVGAVLAQIERTMTSEQLEAIAAMCLAQDNLTAWAEENGVGTPFAGGPPGGQGAPGSDWEAVRATVEAGGGPRHDRGGWGVPAGGRPGGAPRGAANALIAPLVELLTDRAGG